MIQHYLKIAWRNLWKYKTQSAIGIVGLAVCLLCFSICLYVCRLMWATDQCFPQKERIGEIAMKEPQGAKDLAGVPPELIDKLRILNGMEAEAFTYLGNPGYRSFEIEVKPDEMLPFDPMLCMEVDTCFRQVFGVDVLAGSWQAAVHTPNAVILSETLARRIYGNRLQDAIGKRLCTTSRFAFAGANSGIGYTVQAVMADIPSNNSFTYMQPLAMLVLNDSDGRLQWKGKDVTGGMGYVLLKGGKDSRKKLEADLRTKGLGLQMFGREFDVHVRPLGYAYWKYGGTMYIVWIAGIIGSLVLLVGLLNFFYFQVGAFLARSGEYSLRRVFGGGSAHLLGQLFVQAALTVLIAFLLVFVLIELLAPVLHIDMMEFELSIDGPVLQYQCAQYLLLVLAGSLGVCLFTVARTRRINIQTGIRGISIGRGKHRVRNIMLAIQYFICWIFVTLSFALYLQADKTTSALFGTLTRQEKSRILSIPLDYPFMKQAEKLALIERMKQCAGVEDCLLSDVDYTQGASGNVFYIQPDSRRDKEETPVNILSVPHNFFRFMHIPVLQGKVPNTENELVIDPVFGQELRTKHRMEPLGATLYGYYDEGYKVAGISSPFVTNAYGGTFAEKGYVFQLVDFRQYVGHCYLKCYAGKADEVRTQVDGLLHQALPHTVEPRISTFQDDIEAKQGIENALKGIIFFLAVVCVTLTLLGVYAAITIDTESRSKEVAIRKVHGASVGQIMWLFARTYIGIGGATALLAFPLLYGFMEYWEQMYRIFFRYGVWFWVTVFLFVAAVTVFTVVSRIVRIARINPAEMIKKE